MPLKIEHVWVFVIEDVDGDEGVPAMSVGNMMLPLLGADWERVQSLRLIAQEIANARGKPARLLRFDNFTEVEVLTPEGGDDAVKSGQ